MNFRSIADMAESVRANLHKLPGEIDVVVGIPRSGLLAANLVALAIHAPLTDVEGLLAGRIMESGRSRSVPVKQLAAWKKVLVVDDSMHSGKALEEAREKLSAMAANCEMVFCVVFGKRAVQPPADIVLDVCEVPRVFEWNVMHHPALATACVDIDGVLCVDPTPEQNDDGENYQVFLENAVPLYLPRYRIGTLVSSRLEKFRPETEAWLSRHNIEFDALYLLDGVTAEERRKHGLHAAFKTEIYKSIREASIFIESDPKQAEIIASKSGKAALCVQNMVFYPEGSIRRNLVRRLESSESVRWRWSQLKTLWKRVRFGG